MNQPRHLWLRGRTGLLAVAVVPLLLAACNGPAGSAGSEPSSGSATSSSASAASSSAVSDTGHSATVTLQSGYQYQITAGPVSTATTEAASGLSPQDAPPGQEFLQTTLQVTNGTDRQEPLDAIASTTEALNDVVLAVPLVNAGGFGAQCESSAGTVPLIPHSFCQMGSAVSSISGPNSDSISSVQIPPGGTESVVVYASQTVDQGDLPLQDVALFVGDQASVHQLLGPTSPATTTSAGVPIPINGAGVLFFSHGPVQTASYQNGPAGRVELVTHLTITNPAHHAANISGLTNPIDTLLDFAIPSADVAAFGVDQIGWSCGTAMGAPNDTTCTIGAGAAAGGPTSVPAGQAVDLEITGLDQLGQGFLPSSPVRDVTIYERATPIPPQQGN